MLGPSPVTRLARARSYEMIKRPPSGDALGRADNFEGRASYRASTSEGRTSVAEGGRTSVAEGGRASVAEGGRTSVAEGGRTSVAEGGRTSVASVQEAVPEDQKICPPGGRKSGNKPPVWSKTLPDVAESPGSTTTSVGVLRAQLLRSLEEQSWSAEFWLRKHHQDLRDMIEHVCSGAGYVETTATPGSSAPCEEKPAPSECKVSEGRKSAATTPLTPSRSPRAGSGGSVDTTDVSHEFSESREVDTRSWLSPRKEGTKFPKLCRKFIPRKDTSTFIHTLTEGTANASGPSEGSLRGWLDRKLGTKFDLCIGCLVVLNTIVMFVQLEVEAPTPDGGPVEPNVIFLVLNHIFNAVFVVELLVKIFVKQSMFFASFFNWLDACIVITTSLDVYVLSSLSSSQNISFMRMVRFVRVVRALRVIRTMGLFRQLRVLLNTIAMSLMSLFWSMILFFIFMLMFSLLLCQVLQAYVEDTTNDYLTRTWVYRYYGSSLKSLYTVFELTFSGCWPNYTRQVVEDVEAGYSVFFIVYVTAVVFAMVRIISALFLKETLQAAANDADMVVQEKLKEMKIVRAKLAELFQQADTSKDGLLSREELDHILSFPKVKIWLNVFGLDMLETNSLFEMLDPGDGLISYDEFVGGIMRLKGNSRAQDTITIMRDCQRIVGYCENMLQDCEAMKSVICRPWDPPAEDVPACLDPANPPGKASAWRTKAASGGCSPGSSSPCRSPRLYSPRSQSPRPSPRSAMRQGSGPSLAPPKAPQMSSV